MLFGKFIFANNCLNFEYEPRFLSHTVLYPVLLLLNRKDVWIGEWCVNENNKEILGLLELVFGWALIWDLLDKRKSGVWWEWEGVEWTRERREKCRVNWFKMVCKYFWKGGKLAATNLYCFVFFFHN